MKRLICCFLLALTIHPAWAGPIRDRIMERLQNNEIGEEGGISRDIKLPGGASIQRNVAYGSDAAQRMDVYIPANVHDAPVIFMVHGGAWKIGDKAMGRVVENKINRWLPKGIIFVSTNYRMLPKADPLAQANDVAMALAKAQALAPGWGGDAKRFVIMGHSAGAHLVTLLTASTDIAKQQGVQPWLGTVMLDSAAYDIEKTMSARHMELYDEAFGSDPNFWKSVSPINQLSQKTVPMLAVCSTVRKDRPCLQAQAFIDKAKALGIPADVLPQALSHGEINENLGLPGSYTNQVEVFLHTLGLPL